MLGKALELRDMLVLSDKFDDPQALVLSPDVAVKIAEAIVSEHGDYYRRVKSACQKTVEILEGSRLLRLSPPELHFLSRFKSIADSLPEDGEVFRERMCRVFAGRLPTFRERDYWP